MEKEIWLPISTYPKYEVSNMGRVRRGERIRAATYDLKGYLRISFHTERGTRQIPIHKLVAETFLGERKAGEVIRHINGNKVDNRAANLVFGTVLENEHDKELHGTKVCGERHHSNKLTADQVRQIKQAYAVDHARPTLRELATSYGVSTKTIHRIVQGVIWKHLPDEEQTQ